MPDQITDDDRQAHEWCDSVEQNPNLAGDKAHAAARAIRAHIPKPPQTLADELREWGNHPAAFMVSTELLTLADRVETIEKDNTQTHTELKEYILANRQLATERDDAREKARLLEQSNQILDKAATWAEAERDAAQAEVEQLTALTAPSVHHTEPVTTSSDDRVTTLPDPADVPEGEPWLMEGGWFGVRVRTGDVFEWKVINARTGEQDAYQGAAIGLVSRLVPDTRRTVTTSDELDKLPRLTIVTDSGGDAWQRRPGGWGPAHCAYSPKGSDNLMADYGPMTVVYTPEATE